MQTGDKLDFGCQWKSSAMVSGGNLQKWSNGSVSLVPKDTMWNIEFYINVKGNIPKAIYKVSEASVFSSILICHICERCCSNPAHLIFLF